MVPRRHVSSPELVTFLRAQLPSDKHPAIDAVLKQLKACSRRLQAALSSHRTELQILERLYYKGKNQHRTALFWQRVVEMRRYGERLDEMHMADVVENLRLSFWGEQSARTTKLLKGPWTHFPDAKPLLFVLERCHASCALVERARERLVGAYESFTLMMQTGAFLQLVLVLAAIASRMSTLLSEVRSVLETSWSVIYTALRTLFPSETGKVKELRTSLEDPSQASLNSALPQLKSISTVPTPRDVPEEDLGSTLVRTSDDIDVERIGSSLADKTPSPAPDGDAESLDFGTFSLSSELEPARTIANAHVATGPHSIAPTLSHTAVLKRKQPHSAASKPPKKQTKRNEIDDIFGF